MDELSGEKNMENLEEKIEFQEERGIDFLVEKSSDDLKIIGGFEEISVLHPKRASNLSHEELTLSYLGENSKRGLLGKDASGQVLLSSLHKLSGKYKGKEIAVPDDDNPWVERDFLQLTENRSKREAENVEIELEKREKRPKVETLSLSLALPDVSLSLAGSTWPRPSQSIQSLNIATTHSNASLSYSYSHQFSHNPSCSLTRNSSENFDCSAGSHQIWNCGEGTNGSVHSRFRPVGDGSVTFSNHGGGLGFGISNRNGLKDLYSNNNTSSNNGLFLTTSSDNVSFLPSELPARGRSDAQLMEADLLKSRRPTMTERILREIVSESVPIMAQIMQELTEKMLDSIKLHLKSFIEVPEMRGELVDLQNRLKRRSDLKRETLSNCHRSQLEILVTIKMGLPSFLNSGAHVPVPELLDIFLLEKCRNVSCRRQLPVDDCDCKICSATKGFCSECMCPVCLNFDSANNTCSWVGCDACSHWCHTACGLERNLIKPSPCLRKGSFVGGIEMQFHCLGCGHASEMLGFVKEVFLSCAKDWSLENLMKELDCVRMIFGESEDRKGNELHVKAGQMLEKLQNKIMTPAEVCSSIFQFFSSTPDIGSSGTSLKDLTAQRRGDSPKPSFQGLHSIPIPFGVSHNDLKILIPAENKIVEDEWSVKRVTAKRDEGLGSLETLVRMKEAEARMFRVRAEEARAEIENYKQMVRLRMEGLEEEYGEKLAGLCLVETEERRGKKMEELKVLENLHCDYYKMKIRMQSEISSLLKRMEATKQLLV